ncbi:hypothetical protein Hanom_Chr00s000001g01594931 [Helianthus anomalus]
MFEERFLVKRVKRIPRIRNLLEGLLLYFWDWCLCIPPHPYDIYSRLMGTDTLNSKPDFLQLQNSYCFSAQLHKTIIMSPNHKFFSNRSKS